MPAIAVVAEKFLAAWFSSRAKSAMTALYAANATPRTMARLAAPPDACFRQGLRQRGDHAAEQARERERADSRRAAPWRCSAPAPAAFEPDQEADAERDGKAGNQLLKVHGRPGHQIRSVLGVIGPNV